MVLKTEVCRFTGSKIYSGCGIRFIRSDSQVFLFLKSKSKRYFHHRVKPAKLSWTALFRKQLKKDPHDVAVRKKRIVGASLEVIQRSGLEDRGAERSEGGGVAGDYGAIKKTKDEKNAEMVDSVKVTKGPGGKQATRAAQPKAAKTGAGGKR